MKRSFCSVEMRIVSCKKNFLKQLEKNTTSNSYCCFLGWRKSYWKMKRRVADSTDYCLNSCTSQNELMNLNWRSKRMQCSLKRCCWKSLRTMTT